jgi:hypothetical protein
MINDTFLEEADARTTICPVSEYFYRPAIAILTRCTVVDPTLHSQRLAPGTARATQLECFP